MLILADLSGIQDYLFQVRETGGKQARSLRFRSFFIQLVSEAIGIRLMRAAGLEENRIIFSAAGKIAIDGTGLTTDRQNRVREEARLIESWLRDKTHARLRVGIVIHDGPEESMPKQYVAAGHALLEMTLRGWSRVATSPIGWQSSELLAAVPPDPDAEANRDAELGRQVVQSNNRYIVFEDPEARPQAERDLDVVGLRARFAQNTPPTGNGHHPCELSRLARHVPRENGEAIEFVDLAKLSPGAPMLGVLKADADSLGAAVAQRLHESDDLAPLRDLSNRLDNFFAPELDQKMGDDPRWSKLYTVFSGGDDVLLVGPWDIAIDFAGHLNRQFTQRFQSDRLTISAGVAIVKPKFPIRLAARQANQLLEQAKTEAAPRTDTAKDQFAALGGLWKWKDHETIIKAGKQLADWVDQDIIQRGWLHTLLELVLLQRGEAGPQYAGVAQALATSRLAYHVARNWPKHKRSTQSERDRAGNNACQWIDEIIQEFDRHDSTAHIVTIHLPAIVRYAILATRSQGDLE